LANHLVSELLVMLDIFIKRKAIEWVAKDKV
jgi:hypothetical protein